MSEAKEKAAGQKAARSLRNALRREVNSTFQRHSGRMEKVLASAKTRYGVLDRITIGQPHYSFKHHYGYTRKYGANNIKVPGKEHLGKGIEKSGALEVLANEIGSIRADVITAKIKF